MLLLLKWSSILLLYAVLASLMPLLRLALAVLYCASFPDLKAPPLSWIFKELFIYYRYWAFIWMAQIGRASCRERVSSPV